MTDNSSKATVLQKSAESSFDDAKFRLAKSTITSALKQGSIHDMLWSFDENSEPSTSNTNASGNIAALQKILPGKNAGVAPKLVSNNESLEQDEFHKFSSQHSFRQRYLNENNNILDTETQQNEIASNTGLIKTPKGSSRRNALALPTNKGDENGEQTAIGFAEAFDLKKSIKELESLPTFTKQGTPYTGAKKTKRVADVLKAIKKLHSTRIAEEDEFSNSDGSFGSSDDETASTLSSFDEKEAESLAQKLSQFTPKARMSSVDVVADLFNMSNEMRVEREMIVTRGGDPRSRGRPGQGTTAWGGDLSAFLNRDVTLKYNEELDEVAKSKQDEKITRRRAAILRLKRNNAKYQVTQNKLALDDFNSFWIALRKEQEATMVIAQDPALSNLLGKHKKVPGSVSSTSSASTIKPMESSAEELLQQNVGLLLKTKAKLNSKWKAAMGMHDTDINTSNQTTDESGNSLANVLGEFKFRRTYGLDAQQDTDEFPLDDEIEIQDFDTDHLLPTYDADTGHLSALVNTNQTETETTQPTKSTDDHIETRRLTLRQRYELKQREMLDERMKNSESMPQRRHLKSFRLTQADNDPRSTVTMNICTMSAFGDHGSDPNENFTGRFNYDATLKFQNYQFSKTSALLGTVKAKPTETYYVEIPMHNVLNQIDEITFDADTLMIHFVTYSPVTQQQQSNSTEVLSCLSLHVNDLQVTSGTTPHTVVLRSHKVPINYICCISSEHWKSMESEIEKVMDELAMEEGKLFRDEMRAAKAERRRQALNRRIVRSKIAMENNVGINDGDNSLENPSIKEDGTHYSRRPAQLRTEHEDSVLDIASSDSIDEVPFFVTETVAPKENTIDTVKKVGFAVTTTDNIDLLDDSPCGQRPQSTPLIKVSTSEFVQFRSHLMSPFTSNRNINHLNRRPQSTNAKVDSLLYTDGSIPTEIARVIHSSQNSRDSHFVPKIESIRPQTTSNVSSTAIHDLFPSENDAKAVSGPPSRPTSHMPSMSSPRAKLKSRAKTAGELSRPRASVSRNKDLQTSAHLADDSLFDNALLAPQDFASLLSTTSMVTHITYESSNEGAMQTLQTLQSKLEEMTATQKEPVGYKAEGFVAYNEKVSFEISGKKPPIQMIGKPVTDIRSPRIKQLKFKPDRPPWQCRKGKHTRKLPPRPVGNQSNEDLLSQTEPTNSDDVTNIIDDSIIDTEVAPEVVQTDVAEEIKQEEPISETVIEPPTEMNDDVENDIEEVEPKEEQMVMLVETNRLMQLYFAKKFLQLDLALDIYLTPYDAQEALMHYPESYSLVMVSYMDISSDITGGLRGLTDVGRQVTLQNQPTDHNVHGKNILSHHHVDACISPDPNGPNGHSPPWSLVVYGSVGQDDKVLETLEHEGVHDILEEPYTLASLKTLVETHKKKHGK